MYQAPETQESESMPDIIEVAYTDGRKEKHGPVTQAILDKYLNGSLRPKMASKDVKSDSYELFRSRADRSPLLTKKEEYDLGTEKMETHDPMVKAGASAVLFECNLRLVLKIAHKHNHPNLPIMELIQILLMTHSRAVKKFDPRKGAVYSTYLYRSARRAISDYYNANVLSRANKRALSKLEEARESLSEKLGRKCTDMELANELDITIEEVAKIRTYATGKFRISLDEPTSRDQPDGERRIDLLSDETTSPETTERMLDLRGAIERLLTLTELTEKQTEALVQRYGLDGQGERTLEEIGANIGASFKAASMREQGALAKFRKTLEANPKYATELREALRDIAA